MLGSVGGAASALAAYNVQTEWTHFYLGVSHALAGDIATAKRAFAKVAEPSDFDVPWFVALQERAAAYAEACESPVAFEAQMRAEVVRCRALMKLPPLADVGALWSPDALEHAS